MAIDVGLLECPFCDGPSKWSTRTYGNGKTEWIPECDSWECGAAFAGYSTQEEAARHYNRRSCPRLVWSRVRPIAPGLYLVERRDGSVFAWMFSPRADKLTWDSFIEKGLRWAGPVGFAEVG